MNKILLISGRESLWLKNIAKNLNKRNTFEIHTAAYSDVKIFIVNNNKPAITIKDINIDEYTSIICRFESGSAGIATSMAHYCKKYGINFANEYLSNVTYGNKLIQATIFSINNITIPKTFFVLRKEIHSNINLIIENLKLPCIMKDVMGMKGEQNYLIKNNQDITNVLEKTNEEIQYIFQEFIPNDFDYRILVTNESQVYCINKRTRNKSSEEHRNNISLGGVQEFAKESEFKNKKLINVAINAARSTNLNIAGVDVILSKNDQLPYVIEINPSPGVTLNTIEEEALYKGLIDMTNLS